MKRTEFRKQTYVCPTIEVIHTPFDGQLMRTSFPNNGGHEKVGDEGTELNAKNGWFDEEEEEEFED